MQKSILFDLDGTLTDSSEGIIKCSLHAFSFYGIEIPKERQSEMIGPPLRYSFGKFGVPENEIENALKHYRERYLTVGKFENRPYNNVEEMLKRLVAAGHRLFVATCKPEETSIEILEHFGLSKYFEGICGATFDKSRDTKSAVISYLKEKHAPENMIMVGDTVFDVEGAKEMGIDTIGVAWGFGKREELLAAGAVTIAENIEELLNMLL